MNRPKGYFALAYVCAGMIVSQLGHYAVYGHAPSLQTWFDLLGLPIPRPASSHIAFFTSWAAILFYFVGILYYKATERLTAASTLRWGITYWVAVVLIFQLPSSSVMRLFDESSFFLILLAHVMITNFFLTTSTRHSELERAYRELWDILRILVPVAVALPTIIGAGSLVTEFYQDAPGFTKLQLYRRVAIAVYLEFGLLALLVWPVFRRILELRETLRDHHPKRRQKG